MLGSIDDIAFNKTGELLAYTIDSAVKDGNGLFVIDLKTNRLNTLDNDAKVYNRLTWSDDGTALAVLKGSDVDKMRERDNVLLAFANVQAAMSRYRGGAGGAGSGQGRWLPQGMGRQRSRARSTGATTTSACSSARSRRSRRPTPRPGAAPTSSRTWTSGTPSDERVQSLQMTRADQDRNFTFRQAFDVAGGKFVKLADETMRELDVAPDGRWAVGRDTRGFIHDYKRPAADIYRVNTTTG